VGAAIAASLSIGIWLHGYGYGLQKEQHAAARALIVAQNESRAVEHKRYGGLLDALNTQYLEERRIAATLAADLERLRNRPPRTIRVPGDPAVDCAGATGRELSKDDAGFLTRLAARADSHRAALIACYEYADWLQR
jgi:hypothetical protein